MDKRGKHVGQPRNYKNKRLLGSLNLPTSPTSSSKQKGMQVDEKVEVRTSNQTPSNDLSKRINIGTWHPRENTFAVARYNSLFIYTEKRDSSSMSVKKQKD